MTYQVTYTSELMKNHIPGKRMPNQKLMEAVKNQEEHPLVFALNEQHSFTLTMHDTLSPTGWKQLHLGEALFSKANKCRLMPSCRPLQYRKTLRGIFGWPLL